VDVHAELIEMSCVEESSNTPVAVKRACPPMGVVAEAGVSEMDTIFAAVTFRGEETVALPREAVMVASPGPTPKVSPLREPTVAIVVSDDNQFAECVMSRVPPSLKVPIATSWIFVP
jgi:hypothetical protein